MATAGHPLHQDAGPTGVTLCAPTVAHGAQLWRLTRDSGALDLNASYAYLLWCHDFAATSAVALDGERAVGFVTGYLRPSSPDTLMVWQVGVDAQRRGEGLAARLLHHLLDRVAPRWLHTTITPDNAASIRLFSAVARDRGTRIKRRDLFAAHDFPSDDGTGHQPEDCYVIGPFAGDHHTSTTDAPRTEAS